MKTTTKAVSIIFGSTSKYFSIKQNKKKYQTYFDILRKAKAFIDEKKYPSYFNILRKTKAVIDKAYWVEVVNTTKNGPIKFIKDLDRYSSYHPEEKNHSFTHVIYDCLNGCCWIGFLNEHLSTHFIYETKGRYWVGLNSEAEIEEEEEIDLTEYEEEENQFENFEPVEIKKNVNINYSILLKFLQENQQKIKRKQYYLFTFSDTEKAEEYFNNAIWTV